MRIKIECPTYFFEYNLHGHTINDEDPEIIICDPGSSYKYDGKYLSRFRQLKILATPSTGVTHIDLTYCENMGIKVLNLFRDRQLLDQISASSEFTWLHILNAVRKFSLSIEEVKRKNWRNKEDELRGRELRYLSLGIIGFGRIGRNISSFATAFKMSAICFYDPYVMSPEGDVYRKVEDLKEIANCDIIVVSPYLTSETRRMINKEFLNMCRRGTIIVNTSRGEVVNEEDICDAIESGHILYYADVVEDEQNIDRFFDSRLYRLFLAGKTCITPHIAGATVESQEKAFNAIMSIIRSYLGAQKNNE